MSVTQTIRQLMTVNQSRLDTGNRRFTTDGTAENGRHRRSGGLS